MEGTLWDESRFKQFLNEKHGHYLSPEEIGALQHKFRAASDTDIDVARATDVSVHKFFQFVKNRLPPSFLWYTSAIKGGSTSAEKRQSKV